MWEGVTWYEEKEGRVGETGELMGQRQGCPDKVLYGQTLKEAENMGIWQRFWSRCISRSERLRGDQTEQGDGTERRAGRAGTGLRQGGLAGLLHFFLYSSAKQKCQRKKKTCRTNKKAMFYLIHRWQCSPWICIWVILFSWAQGLLIFILAPKYKQKSFCKNQRRHKRKLKQIFNTHLQLNINATAVENVEKPSLITTIDLRSLSDSIPSLVREEVWVTDHLISLSMFWMDSLYPTA